MRSCVTKRFTCIHSSKIERGEGIRRVKKRGYLSICIKIHSHAKDKHRVTWHNDIYRKYIYRIFVFKCIAFWVIPDAYDVY